jgi:hypothetical protein
MGIADTVNPVAVTHEAWRGVAREAVDSREFEPLAPGPDSLRVDTSDDAAATVAKVLEFIAGRESHLSV